MKQNLLNLTSAAALLAWGLAGAADAQSSLVLNGDFSSGGTDWSHTGGGGAYFYNESTVGVNIASLGWWDGYSLWQNTTAPIQAGADYALTVSAQVGQAPLTGVNLTLQDVSAGWTTLASQTFNFASQANGPGQWETFTLDIPASSLTGQVGDTLGVGVALVESPNNQYGWLWMDSVSLVQTVPEPSSLALLASGAVGGWLLWRRRTA